MATDNFMLTELVEVRFGSQKLVREPDGRLVEDPLLLGKVERLSSALGAILGTDARIGDVLSEPGSYVLPVLFDSPQRELNGRSHDQKLEARFKHITDVLTEHQLSGELKTAPQLALTDRDISLAKQASELVDSGTPITISLSGHASRPLPVPPGHALKTIEKVPERPRPIDGSVTGVDRGTDSRIFVRVNNAGSYHIAGMTLEQAFELVRASSRITGMARPAGRDWHLDNAYFCTQEELSLPD